MRTSKRTIKRSSVSLGGQLGLRPGDALLVIDVQRDFLPGGSLQVPDGDQVVPVLNAYMSAFAARHLPIFLTRDWHPEGHCSFRSAGGRWPVHCVQGTPGADWPAELQVPRDAHVVSKATDEHADALSGFSGTVLATLLRDRDVRRVFVGGLATDYCVHDTVLDALSQGFNVAVLGDAIRGVNLQPGDETRAIREMIERGASLLERPDVPG
jgi:nicotinamidase-related amidase